MNDKKECPFCERNELLNSLIFYESKYKSNNRWFAFLDSLPLTEGHTILALKKRRNKCPNKLTPEVFEGLENALKNVTRKLKKVYKTEDILFASLRGKTPHFHFHLIPLHKKDEKKWREKTLYEEGHLFEFLGYLECEKKVKEYPRQRISKNWSEDDQRKNKAKKLRTKIVELKKA